MVERHLELLGLEVEDKVTGYKGIVQSICFDLYGCIQADVKKKGVDKDGKTYTGYWFDINRLKILSNKPIMKAPDYVTGYHAEGQQGAADKSPR